MLTTVSVPPPANLCQTLEPTPDRCIGSQPGAPPSQHGELANLAQLGYFFFFSLSSPAPYLPAPAGALPHERRNRAGAQKAKTLKRKECPAPSLYPFPPHPNYYLRAWPLSEKMPYPIKCHSRQPVRSFLARRSVHCAVVDLTGGFWCKQGPRACDWSTCLSRLSGIIYRYQAIADVGWLTGPRSSVQSQCCAAVRPWSAVCVNQHERACV